MVSISQFVYKKVIYQIFRSFLLVVVFLLWELMIYIVIHLTELFIMSHRAEEVSNIIPQKPDWVKIRQNQFKFNFGDAEKRLLPCKNSTKENFFPFWPFRSEKEYRCYLLWSGIRYRFWESYWSVRTYLSFPFQINKKE